MDLNEQSLPLLAFDFVAVEALALIGFDFVAVEDVAVDLEDAPSHVVCNDRYVVSVSINQDFTNIDLKVT